MVREVVLRVGPEGADDGLGEFAAQARDGVVRAQAHANNVSRVRVWCVTRMLRVVLFCCGGSQVTACRLDLRFVEGVCGP